MKAGELLKTAANLVDGDRAASHGPKAKNHENICRLWNAFLAVRRDPSAPLTPGDVAKMMALLKIARMELGSFNIDNATDLAGYAGVIGEIESEPTA